MDMHMEIILAKMEEQFQKQTNIIMENLTINLLHTFDEKLKPLVNENQDLKLEVNMLKEKIKNLERNTRKNNIILHGIKETEKSYTELQNFVLKVLNSNMSY